MQTEASRTVYRTSCLVSIPPDQKNRSTKRGRERGNEGWDGSKGEDKMPAHLAFSALIIDFLDRRLYSGAAGSAEFQVRCQDSGTLRARLCGGAKVGMVEVKSSHPRTLKQSHGWIPKISLSRLTTIPAQCEERRKNGRDDRGKRVRSSSKLDPGKGRTLAHRQRFLSFSLS